MTVSLFSDITAYSLNVVIQPAFTRLPSTAALALLALGAWVVVTRPWEAPGDADPRVVALEDLRARFRGGRTNHAAALKELLGLETMSGGGDELFASLRATVESGRTTSLRAVMGQLELIFEEHLEQRDFAGARGLLLGCRSLQLKKP